MSSTGRVSTGQGKLNLFSDRCKGQLEQQRVQQAVSGADPRPGAEEMIREEMDAAKHKSVVNHISQILPLKRFPSTPSPSHCILGFAGSSLVSDGVFFWYGPLASLSLQIASRRLLDPQPGTRGSQRETTSVLCLDTMTSQVMRTLPSRRMPHIPFTITGSSLTDTGYAHYDAAMLDDLSIRITNHHRFFLEWLTR